MHRRVSFLLALSLLAGCYDLPRVGMPRLVGKSSPGITSQSTSGTTDLSPLAQIGGRARSAAGEFLSGAVIRAFPVDGPVEGSALVSHHSGGLVSNHVGSLRATQALSGASRFTQAEAGRTTSDVEGRFTLSLPRGIYNLEMVAGDVKAWVPAVTAADGGVFDCGERILLAPGKLTGWIAIPADATAALAAGEIFVPGSPYLARTDATGRFELVGLPAGEFHVLVWKSGFTPVRLQVQIESERDRAWPDAIAFDAVTESSEPSVLPAEWATASSTPAPVASPSPIVSPVVSPSASTIALPGPAAPSSTPSPLSVAEGLAPDDHADVNQHHLYQKIVDGERSTFVWIPVFKAYQLIRPASCGRDQAGKGIGTWVPDRPLEGLQGLDWAAETFGGFYVAQFEASHVDANPGGSDGSGATAGTRPRLKVERRCVPWTGLDWDQAVAACQEYDEHADLMSDEEWTALAVWATTRQLLVSGNDDFLRSADRNDLNFIQDPTGPIGRALTGTGGSPGQGFEVTSHTGQAVGVADLIGNVLEWTGTVGRTPAGDRWIIGDTISTACPPSGFVLGLDTSPDLRILGVPGQTGGSGSLFFGSDFLASMGQDRARSLRGGYWENRRQAGWWQLFLLGGNLGNNNVGFRPVLNYGRGSSSRMTAWSIR